MRKQRQLASAALVVVAVISLSLAGCSPTGESPPVSASQSDSSGYMDTITVTGFGEATGSPDLANIQLGVTVSEASISDAMEQSNQVMERITQAVVALGVAPEDVQTSNFSVWPEDRFDPETGTPSQRVYRVENTIGVKVRQVNRVPDIIEAAIENGANNLYGLNFSIEDQSELAVEARDDAVADARVRAQQLAEQIGVTLGDARIVTEVSDGGIFPMVEMAALGLGGGGGPPISEGRVTVSVRVNVTYSIER